MIECSFFYEYIIANAVPKLFIIQYSSAYATSLFIKNTPPCTTVHFKINSPPSKAWSPPFQRRSGFAISLRIALDWFLLIKKLTPTTTGDHRSAPTIVGVNFFVSFKVYYKLKTIEYFVFIYFTSN